jgi:hypothetical protein
MRLRHSSDAPAAIPDAIASFMLQRNRSSEEAPKVTNLFHVPRLMQRRRRSQSRPQRRRSQAPRGANDVTVGDTMPGIGRVLVTTTKGVITPRLPRTSAEPASGTSVSYW